jgi:hypothetical protein
LELWTDANWWFEAAHLSDEGLSNSYYVIARPELERMWYAQLREARRHQIKPNKSQKKKNTKPNKHRRRRDRHRRSKTKDTTFRSNFIP